MGINFQRVNGFCVVSLSTKMTKFHRHCVKVIKLYHGNVNQQINFSYLPKPQKLNSLKLVDLMVHMMLKINIQ